MKYSNAVKWALLGLALAAAGCGGVIPALRCWLL